MLAASCPHLEIIGLDIAKAETWIKLKRYGAQFVVCNALALPFANEFDATTSFGTMEHTADEGKFLSEINRAIKTGGCLIIFNLPNKYALSEWLAKRLGLGCHERKYVLPQIEKLFKGHGFSIGAVRREFIIPAQVDRVSKRIGSLFNKHYLLLDNLDLWLMRTPAACFAENWQIYARKL